MANIPGIPVWREVGSTLVPRSPQPDHAQVLVVGAGPVGLSMALDLGRKGHQVVVVNRLDFISSGSKGICYAKRTLDIWDRLGVGQRMVDKGIVWNIGKVFRGDRSDPIYQFDMLPLKDQKRPGFINLQQYYVEEFLVDGLRELPNVDIRWGHEVTAVAQDVEKVTVEVTTADGRYQIETPWLVACDGNRSPVRSMLGLEFEGRIFEDNFLIADIRTKNERPVERWFWFDPPFNRAQSALIHKQPDDVWRLDFQFGWNIDREACVRPENVEPFVRGMLGEDIEFTREWYSVYTFQCRRMARFAHHRVIFAGDSAHLVSPFGARGCNGGVADIDNLGWKLDLVIRGAAPRALLESYNDEAVAAADENILNSTRSAEFLTPKTKASTAFREAVLDLAEKWPFARPFVNSGRLSTPVSYPDSSLNTPDRDEWNGGVRPGSPALDAPIGDGWLLDRLGNRFVLLVANDWEGSAPDGVDVVRLGPQPIVQNRYDTAAGGAYLIRPDQYVAARWHNPNAETVQQALAKAKGF
jgi:3-(3-hydroxy-phenyl)propionate hydroxylase